MTDKTTAVDTAAVPKTNDSGEGSVDAELVARLVEQARASGLQLSGEGGLLQQLTKRVLEAALDGEITDHLGYEKASAGSQLGSAASHARTCPTAAANALRMSEVDPLTPPGCGTPTTRTRDGSAPPSAVCNASGSAWPPCASIQVATDSLAAFPTAMTRRTSPSTIALSKIRWRCPAIGDRGSCANGTRSAVY